MPIYPYPTPVVLMDGYMVGDPGSQRPTAGQCLPYQCGADAGNVNAKMWCGYWGYSGAYSGCTDSRCAPYAPLLQCSAPAAATPAAPTSTAPTSTAVAPPAPPPAGPTQTAKTVQVSTPEGLVPVSAELLPSDVVSDGEPAVMDHIASRWEFMDFEKASPFEYGGKQSTLPGWISGQWRTVLGREAAAAAAPIGAESAPLGDGTTLFAWLAVAGVAWLLRDKKGRA